MNNDQKRSWVWYGSLETVRAEKLSVLACFETLVAVGLAIYLIFVWGWVHVIVMSLIAPLLLLRSEEAIKQSHALFLKFDEKPPEGIILVVWALAAVPISALSIRIFTTVSILLKQPAHTILQIPHNWRRVALRTDMACYPELIPNAVQVQDIPIADNLFTTLKKALDDTGGPIFTKTFLIAFVVLTGVAFFAPSYLYRLSLKASSIIYIPFIFLSRISYKDTLKEAATAVKEDWIAIWYSVLGVIILFTLVPIFVASVLTEFFTGQPELAKTLINFFTIYPVLCLGVGAFYNGYSEVEVVQDSRITVLELAKAKADAEITAIDGQHL